MEILLTIDKILALPVVRWLLLAATIAAVATATWAKLQIGTVRLQRDAAQGQSATYAAHLQHQNAAIRQAGKEAAAQRKQVSEANQKAAEMRQAAEKWRREAGKIVLVGTCDQMVDQVITAIKD
jgi:chemotaxis response regulator CheB